VRPEHPEHKDNLEPLGLRAKEVHPDTMERQEHPVQLVPREPEDLLDCQEQQ
jgi:hypothetical protein